MGKATGIIKELSGKIGTLIFQQRKNGKTAVYLAPEVKDTPTRTKLQMLITLVWANLGALFSMFNKTLRHSHESLADGVSDYNAFIQDNCKMVKVYLDKTSKLNGGCVLAPVLISRGKLPSIYCEPNASGVLVTDLKLGDLQITEETTVGDFSAAVMNNNDEWAEDHQLTMFYGQQSIDPVTDVPRAKIRGFKVKLDLMSEIALWDLVTPLGFTSVAIDKGYALGMDRPIVNGAAAWIHTYEDEENGILKVSTQRLTVDSSVLESYMGDAAFDASVASYGGITNTKKAFLRPDAETNLVGVVYTSGANGSNGSGTGENTGGGNGGSSQGGGTNTGGNSGGNTGGNTGSVEPTVTAPNAPVISGTTPFDSSTQVTMTAETGASIHYTTDGSTPTANSTLYSSAITLSDTTTVKAIAVKDGASSEVAIKTFTKNAGGGGSGDMN